MTEQEETKIDINSLMTNIQDVILYLVCGFVFLQIFYFTALRENKAEITHTVFSSFVVGFIICNAVSIIPMKFDDQIVIIIYIVASGVSGLICGKIFSGRLIDKICDCLKIRNTVHQYIWDDLMDNDCPMYIEAKMDDSIINGYVHYIQDYSDSPIVSLAGYSVKIAGEIDDKRKCTNEVIVIDLSKADWVRIKYYNESPICDDIEKLVSNYKEE